MVPADAVLAASSLLSFGVSYDWSFEKEFRRRNPGAMIVCWDPAISSGGALEHGFRHLRESLRHPLRTMKLRPRIPELTKFFDYRSFFRDDAVHVRRAVGKSAGTDTIDSVFANVGLRQRVFVKMDIAGAEYEVWSDLMRWENAIDVVVVEFHAVDTMAERFNECIDAAASHFHVVHVHATRTDHGFPCIGVTLAHKRRFATEPPPAP
jgi:FkbM family methyltransferase